MAIRNTDNSYGTFTKFIHWTIALTIYAMIAVGYWQQTLKDGAFKDQVYQYHKLTGLTVLTLMCVRLIWRFSNTVPSLPQSVPRWQAMASRVIHYALYATLFIMPISGWIMASASGYYPELFGTAIRMPGVSLNEALAHRAHEIHEFMAIVLISLIVIHVLAALKHHFINKNDVLRRMLPTKK